MDLERREEELGRRWRGVRRDRGREGRRGQKKIAGIDA